MRTLAIETSTPRGGVALFEDDDLVFHESFTAERGHSSSLFSVIERGLDAALPGQIVVGIGPGSYAGVRIAIAAAIGLSVASGAELIGVPSISGLASGEYLAIGDARRGGYCFAHVRDGELLAGPIILSRDEIESRIAAATTPIFSSESLGFPRVELRFPDVTLLARFAIANRGIWSRGILEPIYLREPHITTPKLHPAHPSP